MKKIIFFLLYILGQVLSAQSITGVIKNDEGETVSGVAIYVKELMTGTSSNDQGRYAINLPAGKWHIVFQSLGYQSHEIELNSNMQTIASDIILQRQPVMLKEVRVYSGNEDPAISIMRHTIANAPIRLKEVRSYHSEVYIRGTLNIKKIPKLIASRFEVGGARIKSGDVFTLESINEIKYTSPNKYDHKIISSHSTFPPNAQGDDAYIGYIGSSFYEPTIASVVSPLSPSAFSHYKFVYEGFFLFQGYEINQIKVIPKRKSPQLFEGHIYIVDKTWNLQSVDLTNHAIFGDIRVRQTFIPVKEEAWLPMNHNFKVDAAMVGIKAQATYVGTVKYTSVELNPQLTTKTSTTSTEAQQPASTASEKEKKAVENQRKIEEILTKERITNSEMAKAVRLMERQEKHATSEEKSLEVTTNYQFVNKKQITTRSATEWEQIRPIPLTPEELKSFQMKDSLSLKGINTKKEAMELKKRSTFKRFVKGEMVFSGDSALYFRYGRLIVPKFLTFHPVTGFDYRQTLESRYSLARRFNLSIRGSVGYSFAQKKMSWNVGGSFSSIKNRMFTTGFSAGHHNSDLKGQDGANPLFNSLFNLLDKSNHIVMMRIHHLALTEHISIRPGLSVSVSLQNNYFISQENNTNFSIIRKERDFKPNQPTRSMALPVNLETSSQTHFSALVRYTPMMKYRKIGNYKIDAGSSYPTFQFSIRQGVERVWGSRADYTNLNISASQKLKFSSFNTLKWSVQGSKYFNAENLHFSQWSHIKGSDMLVGKHQWDEAVTTVVPYMLSSNRWKVSVSMAYASPWIVLKRLPLLDNTLLNENIVFHHVVLPNNSHYSEAGYILSDGLSTIGGGLFAGFENWKYKNIAIRLIINF